jgi:hypothetical protein
MGRFDFSATCFSLANGGAGGGFEPFELRYLIAFGMTAAHKGREKRLAAASPPLILLSLIGSAVMSNGVRHLK